MGCSRSPILVVNIQSFYSNQFFSPLSLLTPLESLPLTLSFILTRPHREKKEQFKFYSGWISGRKKKLPQYLREDSRARLEIEILSSRWAVVVNFGGTSLANSPWFTPEVNHLALCVPFKLQRALRHLRCKIAMGRNKPTRCLRTRFL